MTKIIGRRHNIAIGKEVTRGTFSNTLKRLDWVETDFYERNTKVMDSSAVGSIVENRDTREVSKWGEGSFTANLGINTIGDMLLYGFGNVTSVETAVGAGSYNHTFTIAENNTHPTASFLVKNDNSGKKFSNGALESLVISAAVGQYVTAAASFMSKSPEDSGGGDDIPDVDIEDRKFVSTKVKVGLGINKADALSKLLEVKNVDLTISKNLRKDEVNGEITPIDFQNQNFNISGTMTLNYDSSNGENLALSDTKRTMVIVLEDDSVTVGNNNLPIKLEIVLSSVSLMEWTPAYSINEIIQQDISFNELGADTQAILTNKITSY